MVSGRYVAPSIFQNLAGLANTYMGQRGIEKAEQAQIDLAKRLRSDEASATADYMQQKLGRPAIAGTPDIPTETYETVRGTPAQPAIPANPQAAYANLYANPKSSAAQRQFAFGKMNEGPIKVGLEDTLLDPFTMKPVYTGAGKPRAPLQIDTGTAIELRDPNNPTVVLQRIPKSMSPADAARLADEGITGYGGGSGQPMVRTGAPVGQPAGQPTSQTNAYAPSSLPVYEPDPTLSPKQNREMAAEFSKENQKLAKNAKNSFDLLKSTAETLRTGNPSSGRGENIITGAREFFGGGGETSKADAILTIYGTKLTQQVPRFEGPQSDKDTALYQAAAGDVGNPNKPIATRLAAVETMIDLNKKYYPKGDWASIDTAMPTQPSASSVKAFGSAKEVDFNSLPTGRR